MLVENSHESNFYRCMQLNQIEREN